MPFKQGISFRATLGHVADGPDDYAQTNISTLDYPTTTPQGVNVGYETQNGTTGRIANDYGSPVDPRISGRHRFARNTTDYSVYRIDLPAAGEYRVRCAVGGESGWVRSFVYDGATELANLNSQSTTSTSVFRDAQHVYRAPEDWPAENEHRDFDFTTQIFRWQNGPGTAGGGTLHYTYFHIESLDDDPGPIILSTDAQTRTESSATLNTGIALNASAVSASITQASLSTSINLAASAQSRHIAASALSTQIRLVSTGEQATLSQADLLTAITLHSVAKSSATAQSDLSIGAADLSGAAITRFNTQAALQTGIALHSAAASNTSADATITIGVEMQALGQVICTSAAALQTGIILSSAAESRHEADAALQTAIQLSSDVTSQTIAIGEITQPPSTLQSSAVAAINAHGDLLTDIRLAAAAEMQSYATGALSKPSDIALKGAAIMLVYASAQLSDVVPMIDAPAGPGYIAGRVNGRARPGIAARNRPTYH